MPLPEPAHDVSQSGARTTLFGLFADGSGEARFAPIDDVPFAASPGRTCRDARFSPAGDWYGRWAVTPLHGILAGCSRPTAGINPEDVVVVVRGRPS